MGNWTQHCKLVHENNGRKVETVYISSDEEDESSDRSLGLNGYSETTTSDSQKGPLIAVVKVESSIMNKGALLTCLCLYLLILKLFC